MTLSAPKIMLIVLNMGLAVGTAFCVTLTLAIPTKPPAVPSTPMQTASAAKLNAKSHAQPIAYYAVVGNRPLRLPLYPPEVVPVKAAMPREVAEVQLGLTLLGTVVEPGHEYGVFITAEGKRKIIAIGGQVQDAQLMSIDATSATLKFSGRLVTLEVIKKIPPLPKPARSGRQRRSRE